MALFTRSNKLAASLRIQAEELIASLPGILLSAEKPTLTGWRGNHALRRAGSGESFWQFREYEMHNTLSEIDWRRSGKTDQIYVRQKERETKQSILFWAAATHGMNFRSQNQLPTKAQAAKIIILSIALLLDRAGEKTGWLEKTKTRRSGTAIEDLENTIEQTKITPHPLPVLQNPVALNAHVVLAGDFLETIDSIETALAPIAAHASAGCLIQIMDPFETDLECKGRAIFENPDSGMETLINHVPSVQGAYRQRIADHCRDVENLCKSYGWNYIFYSTNTDMRQTVQRALQGFEKRSANS